jgi:hypothetical protein
MKGASFHPVTDSEMREAVKFGIVTTNEVMIITIEFELSMIL